MSVTRDIKAKVEEYLKAHPRIQAKVHLLLKHIDGCDGTSVTLWYPHVEGVDDGRESSDDASDIVRILRLTIEEVNTLGNLMGEVADLFDIDVTFAGASCGEFTYYFTVE